MRFLLFIFTLFISTSLFAQYPANPRKQNLGIQTTGDGLVYRGSGFPSYTPSTKANAYVYIDTVTSNYYFYALDEWRKLSSEKYIYKQGESVLATPVKDSLTIYDRLFFAMEITSVDSFDRGIQLPVTGLDSTYAGKVVRVSSMDSSGVHTIFAASSSPDGIAIGDSLATTYNLINGEVVEFQLYQYDTIFQWRLITSTLGGGGGDGNGIISALPLSNVTIDAASNNLRIDSLGNLIFAVDDVGNTGISYFILSGSNVIPSSVSHSDGDSTAQIKVLAQNVGGNSQVELDGYDILLTKTQYKPTSNTYDALLTIKDGFIELTDPDSLALILALQDSITAHRAEIEALKDSVDVHRTAITALQSATTSPLTYFEFTRGNAQGWVIASDTTGLSFSFSSGTATITFPASVATYSFAFDGQDSDLPGNDLTIVINTSSATLDVSGTTVKPRHVDIWSKPDASSAPNSSSYFVKGSPTSPQQRIEGAATGDQTIKLINVKGFFDFWNVSIAK